MMQVWSASAGSAMLVLKQLACSSEPFEPFLYLDDATSFTCVQLVPSLQCNAGCYSEPQTKPCGTCVLVLQVYVDGVLLAAVLDDVVLQPLTGKLMAVMYKWYTPGTGPAVTT